MISIRSSESSPSSTMDVSAVMPAARSLAISRTCSMTTASVSAEGPAAARSAAPLASPATAGWAVGLVSSISVSMADWAPRTPASEARRRGARPGRSLQPRHSATTSSVPSRKPWRHACRWILAAGRFRNAAGLDQDDGLDRQLVLGRDVATNGLEHAVQLALLAALDLVHHDQPLGPVDLDRKGRPAVGSQARMALADRQLDVLRIVVRPANDDQVFQAPGDEHLAGLHEAEVAGPQEGAFARVFQVGVKGAGRFVGPFPIALGHAGTADPDLADAIVRQAAHVLGMRDHDPLVEQVASATDQFAGALFLGQGVDDLVVLQRLGVERAHDGRRGLESAGDHQRGFGHAVTGIERLAAEPARLESLGELFDRFGPHRLGAVESQAPAAEIELGALLGRDLADAQVVGEVRPAADRGAIARDRLAASETAFAKTPSASSSTLCWPMYSGCRMPPIRPMS